MATLQSRRAASTLLFPGINVASVVLWLCTGAKDDPRDMRGLHHLCEHLVASRIRKERYPIFDVARSAMLYTYFQVTSYSEHIEDCVSQLIRIIQEVPFSEQEMETQKQIIRNEMAQEKESTLRVFAKIIEEQYWSINGNRDGLHNVGLDDVRELIRLRFANDDMQILSYAGPENVCGFTAQQSASGKQHRLSGERSIDISEAERMGQPFAACMKESLLVVIPTPGSDTLFSMFYDAVLNYVHDLLHIEIRNKRALVYSIPRQRLLYPRRGFAIFRFPHCGNRIEETIGAVKFALNTARERLADTDDTHSYVRSVELDICLKLQSISEAPRHMARVCFERSTGTMSCDLNAMERRLECGDFETMVELFLSCFCSAGGDIELITI